MLVIRSTDSELDLSGTPQELRQIAEVLSDLRADQSIRFPADFTTNAAPYDRLLQAMEITVSGGPVRIRVVGECLKVTGSELSLDIFASYFQFPDDASHGSHAHHDWMDEFDTEYISPDSRSLVVRVEL
jgi:hypothetical protein